MFLCSYFNPVHYLERHHQSLQNTNLNSPLGPMSSSASQRLPQLIRVGSLSTWIPGLTSALRVEEYLPFSLSQFFGAVPQQSRVRSPGMAGLHIICPFLFRLHTHCLMARSS